MTGHIRVRQVNDSIFKALITVCKIPSQRTALIFSGLMMMGHFLIIPFINPYMEFNKGFSKELTPLIYLFGGIASLGAAIFLGRFADKVGKLPVFSWAVFLSLFMVLLITHMPNVPFSLVLVFFAVWFVLATARAITAQAMVSQVVESEQRGSFMSVNGSIQQLGSGLAALSSGIIVVTEKSGHVLNYNWVGYFSVLVLLSSLIIARIVFRKIDYVETEVKIQEELLQETA
jgi:predicted MFS family arabinose efflux permease